MENYINIIVWLVFIYIILVSIHTILRVLEYIRSGFHNKIIEKRYLVAMDQSIDDLEVNKSVPIELRKELYISNYNIKLEENEIRAQNIEKYKKDAEWASINNFRMREKQREISRNNNLCPYCNEEIKGHFLEHICDPEKATPTGDAFCWKCGRKVILGTFCPICRAANGI